MLKAKAEGNPLSPILHHAIVHGIIQGCMAMLVYGWWGLCITVLIQTSTHFIIDVWKGKMNIWFPNLKNPLNVYHWWIFGLDQMLHMIVLVIIAKILSSI